MIDGRIRPDLDGCTDVDLGWSPITNVIPMRRLGLRVGDSVELLAAWVRFPELDVVANRQRYTRVTENRYESGPYDFELGSGRPVQIGGGSDSSDSSIQLSRSVAGPLGHKIRRFQQPDGKSRPAPPDGSPCPPLICNGLRVKASG